MSDENQAATEQPAKVDEAPATTQTAPVTNPVIEDNAKADIAAEASNGEPTKVDEMVASIGEPIAPALTFKGEGQGGNAMDTMHGKLNDTRPRFAE